MRRPSSLDNQVLGFRIKLTILDATTEHHWLQAAVGRIVRGSINRTWKGMVRWRRGVANKGSLQRYGWLQRGWNDYK